MKAKIRVGDYWFVTEGGWTMNGERATEFESKASLRRAFEWIVGEREADRGLGVERRIEVVIVFD